MKVNYSWIVLAAVWLLSMAANILVFAPMPLTGLLISSLNLKHADVGLLVALPPLMYVLLSIPGGVMADRWSVRKTAGLGSILMTIGGVMRGLVSIPILLFAFTILAGAGIALTIPNLPKIIASWFSADRVGLATGIYVVTFAIGPALVFALTPSILLPAFGGWSGVLLSYGVFTLVVAVVWWILARDKSLSSPKASVISLLSGVIRAKDLWFLGFITTSTNMLWYSVSGWLLYILVGRGFGEVTSGLIVTLYTLVGIPALVLFPILSDKLGLRKPLIWIPLLFLGPISYLLPQASQPIIWILSALFGILVCGVFSLMFVVPAEFVGLERAGGAMGLVLSIGYLGGLIGPWLIGYLRDLLGSFWPGFMIVAIITEVAMVLGLVIKETGLKARS